MSTLSKIVQEAGLSRTAVSEILRGKPGYREDTRQRVLEIANRLGYRPNYLSSALRSGKSMTIGILLSALGTAVHVERVRELENIASRHGYLSYLGGFSGGLQRSLGSMIDRRADGLVIHVEAHEVHDIVSELGENHPPVVWLGQAPRDARNHVSMSRDHAISQLAAHLATQGCRSATFIQTPYQLAHHARLNQMTHHFSEHGITWKNNDAWVLGPGKNDAMTARNHVAHLLDQGIDLPDVLLATNDDCAVGVLSALHERGIRVPEDVALVGFDDMPFAACALPALTTIYQPRAEVAPVVMDMLLHQMENPDQPIEPVDFPCRLIPRQSTRRFTRA